MRALPDVSLVCIDTANHALALRALAQCMAGLRFARSVLLTDAVPAGVPVVPGIDVELIGTLGSRDDYSRFVLKSLLPYVATSHVLLVQWDGFVANAAAWEDAFLDADYIGARWFWFDDGMRVGNGGFSLRSRRLLEALADRRIELAEAEDLTIGRAYRPLLESEYGIRFADEAMADRFAFEAAYPIGKPFGFHGLFNFCRVMTPGALAELPPLFSDAIARSPQCASLLRNCLALQQWQPAIAIAQRILAVEPGRADAAQALAQAQSAAARGVGIGRNDPCPCGSGKRYKQCHGATTGPAQGGAVASAAVPAPAAALPAGTPSADALAARGIDAHRRHDLEAAEKAYRAAVDIAPEHPLALHYLGVVLYQHQRIEEALTLLDRAVALMPREPEFHNNRGLALGAALRDDEAIASFRQALALKPAHAGAWNNLGLALHAREDVAAAIDAYRRALAIDANFVQAHWNLGLALLYRGEYAEGWREYEWRRQAPELKAYLREFPGPRWTGDDPAGRTLLLTAEQGLGDTLQNLRFARTLAARGARVGVAVQRTLVELARTAPGVAFAVATDDALPAFDAHVSLMSLPGMLGVMPETVPAAGAYLRADPARRATAAGEIARATTGGTSRRLAIGLAWSGAPGNAYNRRRAIALRALAPLFSVANVRWFSLQREGEAIGSDDADIARELVASPLRNDFDGTAALVSALDLVVSVDTSIAHLAGALGSPVWILLPFAADWRWFGQRTDSPWYPTARLYRQHTPEDWAAPLAEAALALRALAQARH
jgi:tetratricopeptide (TPR) repeat protein